MNDAQIAKAREAKSAEELLVLAKEYGMEMTEEEAADLYERLHSSTELTDEELEDVAGGCGDSYKYTVKTISYTDPACESYVYSSKRSEYKKDTCGSCGNRGTGSESSRCYIKN